MIAIQIRISNVPALAYSTDLSALATNARLIESKMPALRERGLVTVLATDEDNITHILQRD